MYVKQYNNPFKKWYSILLFTILYVIENIISVNIVKNPKEK